MSLPTPKPRIAIFGGAFDPPHLGHLVVLNALLNSSFVDQIWVVPSGARGDKVCRGSPLERYQWTSLFIDEMLPPQVGRKEVHVNSIEKDHAPVIEGAVELFSLLRSKYPLYEFLLAIGSDLLPTLPQWRHPETLRKEVPFLVVSRGKELVSHVEGFTLTPIQTFFSCDISSFQIKKLGDSGISCEGLLSSRVYDSLKSKEFFKVS